MKTEQSMDISGKRVTVIGGRRSGIALARLIVQLNGRVMISERGNEESLTKEFRAWAASKNVALEFGGHTRKSIEESDMVVLSPGVPFDCQPVEWARSARIPIFGEIEFASQFCHKPIIAVTGSNGKTTVSTLISKLIEKAGYRPRLCGNIGYPFSDYVLDLDNIDYVVLEISSFQLESVHDPAAKPPVAGPFFGFKPKISVILNFSQNHLDRHRDLDEYYVAKKKIYINQDQNDFLVLNRQDPECGRISPQAGPRIVYFNTPEESRLKINPNHSAVMAVGKILDVSEELCLSVFREFRGVEHRMERVRSVNGVDYINDSKATTALAALWALERIDQSIIMICGGRDKNIDFSIIAETAKQKVKRMYIIGEARPKLQQAFESLIDVMECGSLEEAVQAAHECALPGDCVLLSPMCASFDMFTDFEERGRVFKKIVNNLR